MPLYDLLYNKEPEETRKLSFSRRIRSYLRDLYIRHFVCRMIFGKSRFWRVVYKCYYSNPLSKRKWELKERRYKIEFCVNRVSECSRMLRELLLPPLPSPEQLFNKTPREFVEKSSTQVIKHEDLKKCDLRENLSVVDLSCDETLDAILKATLRISLVCKQIIRRAKENNENFELYYNEIAKSLYKSFTAINN